VGADTVRVLHHPLDRIQPIAGQMLGHEVKKKFAIQILPLIDFDSSQLES
jgi:hypothetical protein